MPFDATCGICWHHGQSDGLTGQCRAGPPTEPTDIPQVMTYIRTADTLPACSHFRPLREPEAPPPETKAERIERLRREGVTDMAAWKRAIDGR